ncbi:MAG TPA: hypothetical protein VEA35_12190 [Ramlibacter sp.]|nr:hypothetical protein [Ramlibacter sp.]
MNASLPIGRPMAAFGGIDPASLVELWGSISLGGMAAVMLLLRALGC